MEHTQINQPNPEIVFNPQESKYRLLQDNFITREECQLLIHLLESFGTVGDGYGGDPHPHTKSEVFGGYSFNGFQSKDKQESPEHKQALAIMMKARKLLKSHFGLPFLWLDFGHLVFREPVATPSQEESEEFSHPWHYDNQSLKHRTHTAILYLNEGFSGGLTRFKETDFGPFREVQPQPGRLVAFDVARNAHGVSKLNTGKRYVLNMWFSTHWRLLRHHRRIFKPL